MGRSAPWGHKEMAMSNQPPNPTRRKRVSPTRKATAALAATGAILGAGFAGVLAVDRIAPTFDVSAQGAASSASTSTSTSTVPSTTSKGSSQRSTASVPTVGSAGRSTSRANTTSRAS